MATSEHKDFQKAILKQIQLGLNVESTTHRLEASNVAIDKPLDPNDLDRIKKARMRGGSFSDKIFADLKLVDGATGRVTSEKRVHVADIPVKTPFKTYLVDGSHYQAKNQSQLKGTVYTEITGPGDVVSSFRPERGRNFKLKFNPEKEQFDIQVQSSHIPLYPIMKTLGVTDDQLKKAWGASIFRKNSKFDDPKYVKKFAMKVFGEYKIKGKSEKELDDMVINHFNKESVLNAEATKLTLGKEHKNITSDALLDAAGKILNIHKGVAEPDRKDEIYFKRIRGLDITGAEYLAAAMPAIQRKIGFRLDGDRKVEEIIPLNMLKKPITGIFTKTRLQGAGETTNFLDILSEDSKVTTMGEGGITNTHKITKASRDVRASSLGFLDPVKTSAGTAGITEHITLGASIRGNKIYTKMIDREGKTVEVSPEDLFGKVVAFPDEDGPIVKAVKDGEMINVKPSEVDYRISDAKNMFSMVTNLIPFLQNNSGGRAIFGAAQITQAVPLTEREIPLVQAALNKNKNVSFDDIIGKDAALQSHVSGTVKSVTKKAIKIEESGGGMIEIPMVVNMPLNQNSFVHSEPTVSKGDRIVRGQVIADTNNTKNGTLAMGVNLLTAIMPWKGYNYEDAIVISQKAGNQLTSEHLRENVARLNKNSVVSMDKYVAYSGSGRHKMTKENEQKLDPATGIIRKGMIVEPGETMATILRKRSDDPELKLLGVLTKSSVGRYKADPITWNRDVSGEVVDVEKTNKEIQIAVKTKKIELSRYSLGV